MMAAQIWPLTFDLWGAFRCSLRTLPLIVFNVDSLLTQLVSNQSGVNFAPGCQTRAGLPWLSRMLGTGMRRTESYLPPPAAFRWLWKHCALCAASDRRPIVSLRPAATDLHKCRRTRASLSVPVWNRGQCVLDPAEDSGSSARLDLCRCTCECPQGVLWQNSSERICFFFFLI